MLPDPSEAGHSRRREPRETAAVETANPCLETRLVAAQRCRASRRSKAFVRASPRTAPLRHRLPARSSENACTVSRPSRSPYELKPPRVNFIAPAVFVPSQRLPPEIFVDRGDIEVAQAVAFAVGAEALVCIGVGKELQQASRRGNPESPVGSLEELKHPGRRRQIARICEVEIDNRRIVGVVCTEAEEAVEPRGRPEMPVVVLQQVMKVCRRHVACGAAIRPSAIQAARRRNPQRPACVFHHVRDETLVCMVARHSNLDGVQRFAAIRPHQSIESVLGADPERAVGSLEQSGGCPGPPIVAVGRDDGEHGVRACGRHPRRRLACQAGLSD